VNEALITRNWNIVCCLGFWEGNLVNKSRSWDQSNRKGERFSKWS